MQCNSCREAFCPSVSTKVPIVLNCGHSICTLCLQNLECNQCPVCHEEISTKTKNYSLIQLLETQASTFTGSQRTPHRVSRKQDIEKLFKVSLVGASSVGKTTIMNYIAKGEFKVDTIPTIGVDFLYIDREFNDKTYRIQLWDTAGQQQYRSIAKSHYLNSDAILLVYSLDDPKSFAQLQEYWIDQIKQVAPDSKIFLIGNKSDLPREIPIEKVVALSNRIDAHHYEISCKDDDRVIMSWNKVLKFLLSNKEEHRKRRTIRIGETKARQEKGFFQGLKECWSAIFK